MATRPRTPALRARYERRREDLVVAAARTFAHNGYDQTSMPQLAEAMGLATGSLYHYFPSKERLLMAICDELTEPLLEQARAMGPREDAAAELGELVRVWVGHVVAHRDHMLVFQQERHMIERGDQWRGVRATRKAFERLVEDVLVRASRQEALVAEPKLALLALLGMVNHTAQWYRPRGELRPDDIADGYTSLLIAAQTG